MEEYLKAQSKTNEAIIESKIGSDEIHRFSISDLRWVDNKSRSFRNKVIKKGEIYQFEFGKNYIPEMSYEQSWACNWYQTEITLCSSYFFL